MSAELELAAEAPVTLFRTDDPSEEDFRERRELQGLGDSDGLGSLAPRGHVGPLPRPSDPVPDWKRAGLLRAQKAENDEHSFGL